MENKEKHTTLSLPTFKETDNIKSAKEYLLKGNLNLHGKSRSMGNATIWKRSSTRNTLCKIKITLEK